MRISIGKKLFGIFVVTTMAIILFIAVMIANSMRDGFSQYLAQAELTRFDALTTALEATYQDDQSGWRKFQDDEAQWGAFVRLHLHRSAPPVFREAQDPSSHFASWLPIFGPPAQPERKDGLQLRQRLSVLDLKKNVIVGSSVSNGIHAMRPISALNSGGKPVTVAWLALAAPPEGPIGADRVFLEKQLNNLALTVAVAILLSAIAAWLLYRQFVPPLTSLAANTRILASGDFSPRNAVSRNDEIGDLMQDFNRLAESLASAKATELQWISNTSHELKTPLAVLRADIEALQDGVRKPSKKTLGEVHEAVMRLSGLVEDLNTLSTARENGFTTTKRVEDVGEILADAVQSFSAALQATKLSVDVKIEDGLSVLGDKTRLHQLFDNLLQNTVRYTDAPGQIRISAKRVHSRIEIMIEDTKPAPSGEAIPHLFERFFRAEKSRSREFGGSGLGLSICKSITANHGGTIEASASPLGGLRISVELPFFSGADDAG